jgi:hypothetical protein
MISLAEDNGPPRCSKHCTHQAGSLRKRHGPHSPAGPDPLAAVWVCCWCGGYEDVEGQRVQPADVVFSKTEAV